jgi:DNA repair photolyase
MNIISASRRTDLPAFFPRQTISKIIDTNKKTPVDAVVFWTKNAEPIIPYLSSLDSLNIPYYFQYTLNKYEKIWEPNIPPYEDRIKTFKQLSDLIGIERVVWRYDPIFISDRLNIYTHMVKIDEIAYDLKNHTRKMVFSFFDTYPKLGDISIRSPNREEQEKLFESLTKISSYYKMDISTCAELSSEYKGIKPGKCIDPDILASIGVKNIDTTKDYGQRKLCGCIKSKDIGIYHTCKHDCTYCYAK